MLETEVKFSVHPSFEIPSFDEAEPPLHLEGRLPQHLKATYYDSADLRLARNGITLRYRTGDHHEGGAWHLKLPVRIGDGRTREELHFDGEPRNVPEKIRDLVTVYVRRERLAGAETIHTRRDTWAVRDPEGRHLADLMDDEVSVLQKGRVVTRFRELELEKRDAKNREFARLIKHLRATGAVEAAPIPKVVRVLGPRATAPSDFPNSAPLRANATTGELVTHALRSGLDRLVAHDVPARRGMVEGVHQMRVATRRLRSDLRTFMSVVDETWAASLSEELAWLADALGEVRDLDVLQATLHEDAAGFDNDLTPLFDDLLQRHDVATEHLRIALTSDRYQILVDRLLESAASPMLTDAAESPAAETGTRLVGTHWKKLRRSIADLSEDSPDNAWHRARIKAKRTRYAAEAMIPALSKKSADRAARFARRVADVQDVLGKLQDATVARDVITEIAGRIEGDPDFHLAAGRLLERESLVAAQSRASFARTWAKLDRRKHLSWFADSR